MVALQLDGTLYPHLCDLSWKLNTLQRDLANNAWTWARTSSELQYISTEYTHS